MRIRLATAVASAALAAALAASPARAGLPEGEVYLGPVVGGVAKVRAWDLGENALFRTREPGGTGQIGLRVGFQIVQRLGFELGAQFLPLPVSDGSANAAFVYHGDLLVNILKGDLTPFIVGGAGGYNAVGGNLGNDFDLQFHLGAGLRYVLKDWLVLRAEIRDVLTPEQQEIFDKRQPPLGPSPMGGPPPFDGSPPRDGRPLRDGPPPRGGPPPPRGGR